MGKNQEEEIIHDPGENIEEPDKYRFGYETEFSRKEKWWVILGALKGALLIAAAYLGGIALIIWLMVTFWT